MEFQNFKKKCEPLMSLYYVVGEIGVKPEKKI